MLNIVSFSSCKNIAVFIQTECTSKPLLTKQTIPTVQQVSSGRLVDTKRGLVWHDFSLDLCTLLILCPIGAAFILIGYIRVQSLWMAEMRLLRFYAVTCIENEKKDSLGKEIS